MRFVTLSILLSLASQTQAYNTQVAIVVPVDSIAIDGDLSDWPADLVRYSILLPEFGKAPEGAEDFQGWFRIGYNQAENALFFAVEVQDESVVIDTSAAEDWNTQDGCEVYVSAGNEVLQYAMHGDHRRVFGQGARLQDAAVEVRRTGNRRCYEWRLDVGGLSQGLMTLHPGMDLRMDVVAIDKDADGSFSWMAWGKGASKVNSVDRLGSAGLVERGASLEEIFARISEVGNRIGSQAQDAIRRSTGYQMFFTGILLAFTLLHLLLFLFDRHWRANLYYALYTGLIAGAIFFGFQLEFSPDVEQVFTNLLRELAIALVGIFGLRFLYSLFYPRLPRRFWVFLLLWSGPASFWYLEFTGQLDAASWSTIQQALGIVSAETSLRAVAHDFLFLVIQGVSFIILLETWRVLVWSIIKKKPGAWIVGIGFVAFTLNLSPLIQNRMDISQLSWVLLPLISMSVYLARHVARTNKELEAQLRQVRELSARTLEQNQALVSANQQIQEQNRQIQEANHHKSDFLARMSHDLRTPMNAIIGYTRILLRKTKDALDERQYQNLQNIQISADHLLLLINDILDLSKVEAGRIEIKPEQVDLKPLVQACATSVESLVKPGVELRQEVIEIPPLRTDPDRLRRVLMNLLSNAVKFTEAGSITVAVKPVDHGVELSVADTGVGIPAEDLPHIFEEFRQVERRGGGEKQGTGLGLAIAKKSVELLGGSISVESQVGKGSTFTMRIADLSEEGMIRQSP